MSARARRTVVALGVVVSFTATATFAIAQTTRPADSPTTRPTLAPADDGFPYDGFVTGSNVYVRGGPDTNYYPVMKLGKNTAIRAYREQYGWVAIDPPPGCYSLIDRDYVDKSPDNAQDGVVNGDNVWVRVGSDLDDHRYAKQTQLSKGAKVKILGETADGTFYKIAPPDGAVLWISGQFVKRGRADGRAEEPSPSPRNVTDPSMTERTEKTEKTGPSPRGPRVTIAKDTPTTRPALGVLGKYEDELMAIDAAIMKESEKPGDQRDFRPMIKHLEPIARQDEESVAKLYAERRLEQLKGHQRIYELIAEVNDLRTTSAREHELGKNVRAGIRATPGPEIDGRVEARGELRPSQVFDSSARATPRWYRLVDPQTEKTVAYVALPEGSSLDLERLLGKYVSVRAAKRKLTAGTVDPISVLYADEVTIVQPSDFSPGMIKLPDLGPYIPQTDRVPDSAGATSRPAKDE